MKARKHMIFMIANQPYGITLSAVREVIGLAKIREVPGMAEYFRGLINLRGQIIPTIDLAQRLGIGSPEGRSRRPTIIIADVQDQPIGLLVDEVVEVLPVGEDQIDRTVASVDEQHRVVDGAARCPDRELILILKIDDIINVHELPKQADLKNQASA